MLGTRSVDTHSKRDITDTPTYQVFSKPNRTSSSATMHLSGKAQQIPTLPASEDSVDITLNTAVAENSVIGMSSNDRKGDAIAEISIVSDAPYSKTNLTSTSVPSVQEFRDKLYLDTSSQKVSLADDTL